MVSTKDVGRTPVTSAMMSPRRDGARDGRHLAELTRHRNSSPAPLLRRERTRIEAVLDQTGGVKDIGSLLTANGADDPERQLRNRNKREYGRKTTKPNLFRIATALDHLPSRRLAADGSLTSKPRLVRNLTSLEPMTSSPKQNDASLEIHGKIRREPPTGSGEERVWADSELAAGKPRQIRMSALVSSPTAHAPDDQTSGSQQPIRKSNSIAQISAHVGGSPQHLPSLARDDVKHDVTHKREDRPGFDNPRFSIPAARGLPRHPTAAASGGQREGEREPSHADQPQQQQQQQQQRQQQQQQRPRAESLPVTIMDIANATSGIRQSRTGQCLFNNDADVRRFRNLIRDPEARIPNGADVSKMKHINYCNREKTKLIIKWLSAVDPRRVPEGAWSADIGTNVVNKDGGSTY